MSKEKTITLINDPEEIARQIKEYEDQEDLEGDQRKQISGPKKYRRNTPTMNTNIMSVNYGAHLLTRIHDITRKRGFITASEFIRYAVRKELDYQADLLYMPGVPKIDQI